MQRLRLRGDWSDTGPNARPENNPATSTENEDDEECEIPGEDE